MSKLADDAAGVGESVRPHTTTDAASSSAAGNRVFMAR
jgi:hypothetical protein